VLGKARKTAMILLPVAVLAAGCVERLITVRSQPVGALVWLNGEEVGRTPVTAPFTWYGRYEVVLRQAGYETVRAPREAVEPFWQWPVVDLVSECLLPFTLRDHQEWDFVLAEQSLADPNALIQRAEQLRGETLAAE